MIASHSSTRHAPGSNSEARVTGAMETSQAILFELRGRNPGTVTQKCLRGRGYVPCGALRHRTRCRANDSYKSVDDARSYHGEDKIKPIDTASGGVHRRSMPRHASADTKSGSPALTAQRAMPVSNAGQDDSKAGIPTNKRACAPRPKLTEREDYWVAHMPGGTPGLPPAVPAT